MSNFEILLDRPGDIIQRHVFKLFLTKKYGPLDNKILKIFEKMDEVRSRPIEDEKFWTKN